MSVGIPLTFFLLLIGCIAIGVSDGRSRNRFWLHDDASSASNSAEMGENLALNLASKKLQRFAFQ